MSTDNFPAFAEKVHASFQALASRDVFVTDVDGDALYALYLASFPEGSNPKFKERSEHDCACCKQFIRRAGSLVTEDGHTVWETAAKSAPYPYNEVAKALHDAVTRAKIVDLFRVGKGEASFGARQTRSQSKTGAALTWNHFYTGDIPTRLRSDTPDQVRGDYRTTVQVFERGLVELSPSAVATVLSLVDDNTLYRGAEHRPALVQFQDAQRKFLALEGRKREMFIWTGAHGPASRFRNTVIGTLVTDLSNGVDIEVAVKAFETKVAPQNYKRTSAVITPAMVDKAMETIRSMDLEPAMERRFARMDDISVNDVLWADGSVKPLMKGGLADALHQHATAVTGKPDTDRAENISMDKFLKEILPTAASMDLLFEGKHLGNLMSLTAPKNPEPKQLFKWTNDFAWSYGGNVTDSIKERVKKAGGNVTNAQLRISLSWFNYDDLDLHVFEPNGNHIYFGAKRGVHGVLDVDMNAGGGHTREAVENVAFVKAVDGVYRVVVNNFHRRETDNEGFVIEVENAGKLSHFSYRAGVRDKVDVNVVTLVVQKGVVVEARVGDLGITSASISQDKWGLHTEQYVKVCAVTLSPNYWGENRVGNKHHFFVLEGAKNDEATRGIYNEFLHPRLEQHRKVFEVIGEKTKCQPTDGQLSGLGFSSTKQDAVVVRVKQGKKQRLFCIQIAEQPSTTNKGEDHHVPNQRV